MKKLLCIVVLTVNVLFAQGTYYNSIDTSSASFVIDLHNLIYPHTRITYDQFDETNVANFASRDTTGGQKVVTCVYSGENYVYTPPFTWTVYSREHTWCQSWMPSNHASGFSNRPEYSDQHHLYPLNQNKANGVRSNHPEGNVTSATYTYLACKLGLDTRGATVFEPRASHKGDCARALLYMAVCYNGVDGFDWTFDNLNRVLVDSLGEAAQDVNTLLQWHSQDPPDQWEKDRNEYVYSIQGNRNPFIDHPEYVNVIDFNTLKKKSSISLAAEPTYYPKGFSNFSPTITDSSITVRWADTTGSTLASGYILMASTNNTFADPADGVVYADDTNLVDGTAKVNIAYASADTFRFSGLTPATSYAFKIYPYNGDGAQRNYKTDNFPTSTNNIVYTTTGSGSANIDVVVNEYMNGADQTTEWVELLVQKNNLDMRGMKLRDYSTGGSTQSGIVFSQADLWSSVSVGSFIVILAATNPQAEDLSFTSDKKIIVSATNPLYFTGSSFNIGGSADAIEILSSGSTHIHSLSHGSKPGNIGLLPSPTANVTGSSTSATVVCFLNISSNSDFGLDAKTNHNTTATQGLPNDASETVYIGTVLPVELISFQGAVVNNAIVLTWKTATEMNNYGFEIERSEKVNGRSEMWNKIGFVEGNGNSNSPKSYSYVDVIAQGRAAYRLKQIDRDGKFTYSHAVEVTINSVPKEFALSQNYPNPFNPTTEIRYQMSEVNHVTLKVYDVLGKEVETLVNEVKEAGYYSAQFDASKLSSGIYFARIQSNGKQMMKKMMLVK